jgi:hypothetical protein
MTAPGHLLKKKMTFSRRSRKPQPPTPTPPLHGGTCAHVSLGQALQHALAWDRRGDFFFNLV